MSIQIYIHAQPNTVSPPVTMKSDHIANGATIEFQQGCDSVIFFIDKAVATTLAAELQKLYPELAAAGDPPTDVVMHYADSHAQEVAAKEDDAIAAMVAELADSPNARKFGSESATTNAT